jgi:hypothetical protein
MRMPILGASLVNLCQLARKQKSDFSPHWTCCRAYCSVHSAISVYSARQAQLKATRMLREVGNNCNVAVVFQ